MLIINAKIGKHSLAIYGDNLELSADPQGDDSVKLDSAVVIKDGKTLTYFNENFQGHKFTAEEAAESVIRAYINNDISVDVKTVNASLAAFRDNFICGNGIELKEGNIQRKIPRKYLTKYYVLDLELIDAKGRAYYSDGDNYVMTYADGSIATDIEALYSNAFFEAMEEGNNLYATESILAYDC